MKIPDLAHGQQDGETGDLPSFANRNLSPHQAPGTHGVQKWTNPAFYHESDP